jgi:hypothetical protein
MKTFDIQTLTTSAHPNELFRFVHFRNPILPIEAQEQALFFTYQWAWAVDNTDQFLHTLQAIRNNWGSWADLLAATSTYKATQHYIHNGNWFWDNTYRNNKDVGYSFIYMTL